jgi:hypothetical protein
MNAILGFFIVCGVTFLAGLVIGTGKLSSRIVFLLWVRVCLDIGVTGLAFYTCYAVDRFRINILCYVERKLFTIPQINGEFRVLVTTQTVMTGLLRQYGIGR